MIVVDTSALIAVVLKEVAAARCIEALTKASEIAISAGTVAEALIVAQLRGVGPEMRQLIDGLVADIEPVTASLSLQIADAYAKWGKGVHPAGLNFGDCFAYALAKERNCPLLFVGNDFNKTGIASAL